MDASKEQKLAIRRNCGFNEEFKTELVQWVKKDNSKKSLNELNFDEANQILIQQGDKPHRGLKWANFDKNNPKHKVILSLLYQGEWVTNFKGKVIPDLDRFSEWLKTKSPVKKPLKKMDNKELEKIIKALTKIVKGIWK